MRVRKLSPTERLYIACEDLFPPFAIQLLLTSKPLPSVAELQDAIRKVVHANPGIRLEAQRRWWLDLHRIPQVRTYSGFDGEPIEAPLIREKIKNTGPACEIVVWENRGLLFRASHALMDAGGLLFWAEEMFRALRGEALLGSSFMPSDYDFLKSLNYPSSRKPFRFNCRSARPTTSKQTQDFSWTHQVIPGQHPAYVAKLAQKIAAEGACKNNDSRFMIPFDLRRIVPAMNTTMNYSNPLFLELKGTEEWEEVYQLILESINSKAYQAIDWKDQWIMLLPNGVIKQILKYLHGRSLKKNHFALSAVLSHVGTVSLSRLTAKNFIPSAACFMPIDIPGVVQSIVSVQHDHALELTTSFAGKFSQPYAQSSPEWLVVRGEKKIWETEKENIYELIAEQARTHPELIAATYQSEQWCYRVLIEKSAMVHAVLSDLNLGPGDVIAIFLNGTLHVLAAILGVLRAGAAFMPIDTAWPRERQHFILQDANATALISDVENGHKIDHPVKIIWENLIPGSYYPAPLKKGTLAYILYTSGSTGLPKGIKVGHASLRNYILWARDVYQLNNEKTLCFPFFTPLVFDLTLTSIFLPWLTKGQVKVISNKTLVEQACEVLQDNEINSIKLTPSHLSIFNELGFEKSGIERLIIGGEALSTSLVRTTLHQKSDIAIFNEYGPTEATVGCMVHRFDSAHDKASWVPIGKPIANCDILLKSDSLSSSHELYITGHCLALGYLGHAVKDCQNFLPHPYKTQEQIYRTGDYVSVNNDGQFVYHGRLDEQVKIRGYRVELREIEACILASEWIKSCAVIVSERADKRLIAYVVWKDKIQLNNLQSLLRTQLPVYMIPEQIITVNQLQLTINGKIDKQFLVNLFDEKCVESPKRNSNSSTYLDDLLSMLAEVLGVNPMTIDKHRSLLEQGVDSLSMAIFLTRILNRYFEGKNNFELFFSEADFIQNPTLEQLEFMIIKELQ
ncbi:TPA: non-ribosomal peptide synthetase [Legionella pneumophila]|nr:non-ribosomal peptide synthetase [Legionella pneumophila]